MQDDGFSDQSARNQVREALTRILAGQLIRQCQSVSDSVLVIFTCWDSVISENRHSQSDSLVGQGQPWVSESWLLPLSLTEELQHLERVSGEPIWHTAGRGLRKMQWLGVIRPSSSFLLCIVYSRVQCSVYFTSIYIYYRFDYTDWLHICDSHSHSRNIMFLHWEGAVTPVNRWAVAFKHVQCWHLDFTDPQTSSHHLNNSQPPPVRVMSARLRLK